MENNKAKLTIGFIGQGYVGKNYADSFESRGYPVIRYSLEPEYVGNREKIKDAEVVVIAVPTPTRNKEFDDTLVREALGLLRKGQSVVIKSTVQKGTTARLQEEYPDLLLFHVPEFLREAYAREDVDHPARKIIGYGRDTQEHRLAASVIEEIFPHASYTKVMHATDAEFIKYTHNTLGMVTIVYANVLYDLAEVYGVDWASVRSAVLGNPWFPEKYLDPVHKGGRGAGGHCFIKDFAALVESYEKDLGHDKVGIEFLRSIEKKNNQLLRSTNKDLEILHEVYGEKI